MISRDGLAQSPLCLPTCFLTRSLGWMLSRDGLAWSALDPPTFSHLSPHLFPHALAGLVAVTRVIYIGPGVSFSGASKHEIDL